MSDWSAQMFKRFLDGAGGAASGRRLHWPGGVVSFSFDDFPRSALVEGGAILESFGARGTYYTAFGLKGSDGEQGPLFELDDLRRAHAFGHEIGCHTYNHVNCATATRQTLLDEAGQNAAALTRTLGGMPPRSFAFPYGAVSEQAKKALKPRYSSCRGIQPGFNRARRDLAELKANKIYHREYDAARIRALIDEAQVTGAWLIFYTHDVREAPSPWGCRPEQLEAAIAYAVEKSTVLPVGEVLRHMTPVSAGA